MSKRVKIKSVAEFKLFIKKLRVDLRATNPVVLARIIAEASQTYDRNHFIGRIARKHVDDKLER